MKRLLSSLFRIAIATIMVIVAGAAVALKQEPGIVQAVGDLTVTFPSSPFFSQTNMAPGDNVTKSFTVQNNGTVPRLVAVRAHNVMRNPLGPPDLDDVLTLKIKEGATTLHTFSFLKDFLNDADGVSLSILGPGDSTTYTFEVAFPSSAGNEFQGKSVQFDLTVGAIISDHLVVNEVFFFVDPAHGADCNFGGGNNSASNTNTGPGSTNVARIKVKRKCEIRVKNKATVTPSVVIKANTGGNLLSNNTNAGNLTSGNINVVLNFNVIINQIADFIASGQSDEWIELYNPTGQDISLKNWKIVDNSGLVRTIHANKTIKAGKFALLVKSASTFSLFWSVPPGTLIVEMGQIFGNGLDNAGDRVRLLNPSSMEIDAISWGTDTYPPRYTGPIIQGHSIERLAPGFDTDAGTDFEDEFPPTPGFD